MDRSLSDVGPYKPRKLRFAGRTQTEIIQITMIDRFWIHRSNSLIVIKNIMGKFNS